MAVVLLFVGIGVIGLFTGSVAGFFVEQEAAPPSDVEARLARIEAQLALRLERQQPRADSGAATADADGLNARSIEEPDATAA